MSNARTERHRRVRGDVVTCRYVGLGQTFVAAAAIVDHDDERSTGVYVAPGFPEWQIRLNEGSYLPRVVPAGFFRRMHVRMEAGVRGGGPSLIICRPGRAHVVHVHWRGDDWLRDGFYVNLQEPMTEAVTGFKTTDQFLDIVIDAGFNWRWKDEDELEEAVAVGRLTVAEADAVRFEGERVVADIEARRWPFDGSYDSWRPDPAWPVPVLPEDWNIE